MGSEFAVGSNQYKKRYKGSEANAETRDVSLVIPVRSIPDSRDVITADRDDLNDYVTHHDWHVRADAAANPHLTTEQARFLADPDEQPVAVRASVALSAHPNAAELVKDDPSPTVRALACQAWDIDPATRQRLESEAQVRTLRPLLAG